jgi:3-(methylthio)propanoyl-CoA dehydrogenase
MEMGRRGDRAAQARVDLLTPVVKAWCTDVAQEVASTALQVHGGMGFIEETGAAQFFRDARITPIYEGTNGIQAMDLALRKVVMDSGAAMNVWLAEAEAGLKDFAAAGTDADWRDELAQGLAGLRQATDWVVKANDPEAVAAVAAPYLQAFGIVAGGSVMARSVLAARDSAPNDNGFRDAKIATARFYGTHLLPRGKGAVEAVLRGSPAVSDYRESFF